jgi:hypothetical protein
MKYALIKNGVVENVIIAEPDFASSLTGYDHIEPLDTEREQRVTSPGWLYDASTGEFSEPPMPEPIPEPRHISVGAFYDRFGAAKYAILTDTNPMVQALIKDASVRQFIDLDRPDLSVGLSLIVDAGHEIDINAVLNAPIQPGEQL